MPPQPPPRPARPSVSDSAVVPSPAGAVDPLVGREIAGHRVLQRVATGRLCSTYKAEQTAMARPVALKALSPDVDENTLEKFLKTARTSAQLHHPSIASIYDVGADGGVYFCTMEFVEGQTLADLLRGRQRFPSADAIRVALDVAQALGFANARGIPGWRLSANRVVITKRGEVKVLPPTFSPAGAPVLDDRYVTTAIGVLLYAMLTGGKVHDLEWALEPGSSAPKQFERLKSVAPGVRNDVALVVERLLGLAGEPFPSLDAALHGLRALLAAKEQLETRTRKAGESARERVQRTRTGLYVALGVVGLLALVALVLVLARSGASARAERRFAEAKREADAAVDAFKAAQGRFHAAPSDALAQQALGHLEKVKAAYAAVAADYPDHPKGQAAAQMARSYGEEADKFRDAAAAAIRYAAVRSRIIEVDKALAREFAERRERGGIVDTEAWRKRYLDLAKQLADSPQAVEEIYAKVRTLPRRVLEEQIEIDANATSNEVLNKHLPALNYGKALEAWDAYRQKYGNLESAALRKKVLETHGRATSEIKQAARVKYATMRQQAEFLVKEKRYDEARAIYNRVVQNFGIARHVDDAKDALAKIPK
ncbi:MAG: hypothetical protein FJ291_25435 [Planctomycetes bacterium]|nr:hypothetical protein [Planctomycetota bacterium]